MTKNNYPRDIYFVCPECGKTILHEERTIVQTQIVERISTLDEKDFGVSYDGGGPENRNTHAMPLYKCANCCTQFAYGEAELYKWLMERGMALQWYTPEWEQKQLELVKVNNEQN